MGPSACQSLHLKNPRTPIAVGLAHTTAEGLRPAHTSRLVPALAPLPNLGDKLNLFLLLPASLCSPTRSGHFCKPEASGSHPQGRARESKSEPTSGDSWVSITVLSQRVKLGVGIFSENPNRILGPPGSPCSPPQSSLSLTKCDLEHLFGALGAVPLFKARLRAVRRPAAQDWGPGAPCRRAQERSCHPCARKLFQSHRLHGLARRARPRGSLSSRPQVGSGSRRSAQAKA